MAQASLARLKTLSPVQQRRAAAVLGALVADAATAPLHWIYDQAKVKELTEKGMTEFYPTSQCPYNIIATGQNSGYGDQLFVALKTLAKYKAFEEDKMAGALFKFFGPNTIYEDARKQTEYPVKGPWTNHNLKTFITNREKGDKPEADAESKDPDGLMKSIAVVALLSGKPELLETVAKNVGIVQSNPVAIGFGVGGARILDHVIQTGSNGLDAAIQQLRDGKRSYPLDTDEQVAVAIEKGKAASGKSHQEAVKEFGLPCVLPGSFSGMVQGITTATDFPSAIRNEILAAGDNCSRGGFIGACVAARYGLDSIPLDWIQKVKRADEILKYIEIIVQ